LILISRMGNGTTFHFHTERLGEMAEDGLLLLTASYKLVSRNDQTRVNPALTQYVCAVLKGKVDKSLISSKGARGEAWDYSLRVTEKKSHQNRGTLLH